MGGGLVAAGSLDLERREGSLDGTSIFESLYVMIDVDDSV